MYHSPVPDVHVDDQPLDGLALLLRDGIHHRCQRQHRHGSLHYNLWILRRLQTILAVRGIRSHYYQGLLEVLCTQVPAPRPYVLLHLLLRMGYLPPLGCRPDLVHCQLDV